MSSMFASSSYWQNFALNLFTELVGALITAFVLERLLRKAYFGYKNEQISISKNLFLEVTTRVMYWLMFDTPDIEKIFKQVQMNEKNNGLDDEYAKAVIKIVPKIIRESFAAVIFQRKEDRVKSILLDILRSSFREPLANIELPSSFSILINKGQNIADLSPAFLDVFEKVLPKILDSKEVQTFGHPHLIEAMHNFPEISKSIRQNMEFEQTNLDDEWEEE